MNNVFGGMVSALSELAVEEPLSMQPREDRYVGKAPNAESIAQSWANPDVRQKRLTTDGVRVTLPNGGVRKFSSTREAFRDLRLPDQKHVRFRLKLKAERVRTYQMRDGREYRFEIVARD
ncbi:hypothetical protein [Paraburkholderia fungorum]|uniref:Uncharacterized protein n=1 Tax=Paraburkholderia fungorum TaxID=134537 RepID=A0AAW3UYT3_9BURK|nr:hypothetical protein [Paraburkholderia fungorum]MBB4515841.1 hypothetical protein [Paraburkholderia fungorum]MBB6203743.1 hypothetical protein [Paraburkholderia fungorum]